MVQAVAPLVGGDAVLEVAEGDLDEGQQVGQLERGLPS